MESCNEIINAIGLETKDSIAGITQTDVEPILDGNTVDPHPKYSDKTITIDIFYNTTLDRLQNHINVVEEILIKRGFPSERVNIYNQLFKPEQRM